MGFFLYLGLVGAITSLLTTTIINAPLAAVWIGILGGLLCSLIVGFLFWEYPSGDDTYLLAATIGAAIGSALSTYVFYQWVIRSDKAKGMKPTSKWSKDRKFVWLVALGFPIVGTYLHVFLFHTWHSFFQPISDVVTDILLFGPGYLVILFAYLENRSDLLGSILFLTVAYVFMYIPLGVFFTVLGCDLYRACP